MIMPEIPTDVKTRIAYAVAIIGGLAWTAELIMFCKAAMAFKAAFWP